MKYLTFSALCLTFAGPAVAEPADPSTLTITTPTKKKEVFFTPERVSWGSVLGAGSIMTGTVLVGGALGVAADRLVMDCPVLSVDCGDHFPGGALLGITVGVGLAVFLLDRWSDDTLTLAPLVLLAAGVAGGIAYGESSTTNERWAAFGATTTAAVVLSGLVMRAFSTRTASVTPTVGALTDQTPGLGVAGSF